MIRHVGLFQIPFLWLHALSVDLSPPCDWHELSQSAPTYKYAFLDSTPNMSKAYGNAVFENNGVKHLGLCRWNREFKPTWCCLLHLSKWAEVSISWREVSMNRSHCQRMRFLFQVDTDLKYCYHSSEKNAFACQILSTDKVFLTVRHGGQIRGNKYCLIGEKIW